MVARIARIDFSRLAIPAFFVVLVVFAGLRLFGVGPWTLPAFDVYAYWTTRAGLDYSATQQGVTGAYLYSPAFAQLIAPLTALPWTAFAAIWTILVAAPLAWLAGRHALVLLVLPPVFMSVALGQLDLAFAAVVTLGLRWPALWALPILTKVTPGIGLLWFFVRGEWRSLGIALGTSIATVVVSAAVSQHAWSSWISMLARMDFPQLGGGLWFLPLPLVFRLFVSGALIAWGAATDRRWVLPVGVCLSLPTVWLNSPTILIAILPLAAAGATSPAGRWVRSAVPPAAPASPRRRLRTWLRRAPAGP